MHPHAWAARSSGWPAHSPSLLIRAVRVGGGVVLLVALAEGEERHESSACSFMYLTALAVRHVWTSVWSS